MPAYRGGLAVKGNGGRRGILHDHDRRLRRGDGIPTRLDLPVRRQESGLLIHDRKGGASIQREGKSSSRVGCGGPVFGKPLDGYGHSGQGIPVHITHQSGDQGKAPGVIAGNGGIQGKEILIGLSVGPGGQGGHGGDRCHRKILRPRQAAARRRVADRHRIGSGIFDGLP